MRRRDFAKLLLACGAVVSVEGGRRRTGADRHLSFQVAGVRFQEWPGTLRVGDFLRINAGSFKGELCYEILTANAKRIGYAPRSIVPILREVTVAKCILSRVREDAVPWRRYEVTVVCRTVRQLTGTRRATL